MSDAFMFKDKLAMFSHRREVIFTHVYRSNEIGAKLIKWLCVSCLATLNYSCLFDCCVWRIYWEVVHQRANPCLGCCSSNSTGKVPFTVCEVTLNSHWGILICLFSSLFFIILHLCLYLWPCSTCLLSICQIFFFLLLLLLHKTGDTGMKSMPTSLNLPAYTICGPWLVSPSNGI